MGYSVNVGDMVKFSKEHTSQPGLTYSKDWIGVIIELTIGTGGTEEMGFLDRDFDEIEIMWTILGDSHIMKYGEEWWNQLGYDPFEVVYENR